MTPLILSTSSSRGSLDQSLWNTWGVFDSVVELGVETVTPPSAISADGHESAHQVCASPALYHDRVVTPIAER